MAIEKGPGDIKYPTGKAHSLKKMADGNPFPYESTYVAEDGVQDGEVAEGKRQFDYSPDASGNIGDDGRG